MALQYGNAFGQGMQAAALKPADFFGNDSKAFTGLSGSSGFNCRIKCKKIGLFRNFRDGFDHLADTLGGLPQPIHLADYREPAHWVDRVHLEFALNPTATRAGRPYLTW